jgi:hypothetical protein
MKKLKKGSRRSHHHRIFDCCSSTTGRGEIKAKDQVGSGSSDLSPGFIYMCASVHCMANEASKVLCRSLSLSVSVVLEMSRLKFSQRYYAKIKTCCVGHVLSGRDRYPCRVLYQFSAFVQWYPMWWKEALFMIPIGCVIIREKYGHN